ncbi:MAG: ankyrin repeat domain-containing protein [Candidatus Solibacter usitatus]|nr:ankyrin repeat domain-containing protein [Candidatus Solibacter usitatus]
MIKAAKHGDLIALRDAIRSGSDLNGTDSQGWTPLFHAAHNGWTEGMQTIIEAGADVNHGSENGSTALFSAVMSGRLAVVELLIEAGAQARNVQGVRLTQWARGKDRGQIIAALERANQRESTVD